MTAKAKIFTNGGSQAVRLPKSCSFPKGLLEVTVRKEGPRLILEPSSEWPEELLEMLGTWDEEIERPPSTPIGEVKDPFD